MQVIDYRTLLDSLPGTPLQSWLTELPQQLQRGLDRQRYGDLDGWLQALSALPQVITDHVDLQSGVSLQSSLSLPVTTRDQIRSCLEALIPWRKGPYDIHGIHIDSEWRSDWKWQRILPHLAPLDKRLVLDVGCGNGYHCWRMFGAGAGRVIGIDPSPRFVVQFHMLKHFLPDASVDVLPLGIESLPDDLQAFDTTFSMGVFYHRRSPMDHLRELKSSLRPGGQLVLETLVINGEMGQVLVPEGRYAMMNNVWFLPSCATLLSWMRKCGLKNPRLVDLNRTTTGEQRSTAWMRFHSLADFLDPENPDLTAEGHPAPLRGVFIAEA